MSFEACSDPAFAAARGASQQPLSLALDEVWIGGHPDLHQH